MTLRFGAYPPDKIDRSEARQEQAGNENWADDRFRSIKREVTRNPHEWEQGGGNRFEGDLQQFDGGDEGCSGAQGNQLGADRNPWIAEQQITEWLFHWLQYTGLSRQPGIGIGQKVRRKRPLRRRNNT